MTPPAGQPLTYTIAVDNAGPAASPSTTVVDIFPTAFTNATWNCLPSGGAICTVNGNGNITQIVSLPAGSSLVYAVHGAIAPGTSGTLANTVTAVVGGGVSDPEAGNNTGTLDLEPATDDDLIFADDFEAL